MKKIWKMLIVFSVSCFSLFGCGQEAEKETTTTSQEQEKVDCNTIKKDIADFCSQIEIVNTYFSIVIADEEQADFSHGDSCIKEAKEIFENKIQNSKFDSVYINDIKEEAYSILSETENIWSGLKNGQIGIDDYEEITKKAENISGMCDKLKSYLG